MRRRQRRANHPTPYRLLSYVVVVHLTGEQTGGRFSVAEYLKPSGDMTPLHIHRRESQTTYVIEGEATIYLPDGPHVLRPGECLFQPAGVPHTELVTSKTPARLLDIYAPAGFERFVTMAGRETRGMIPPRVPEPPPDQRRVAQLRALARDLGVEVLGPPGRLPAPD